MSFLLRQVSELSMTFPAWRVFQQQPMRKKPEQVRTASSGLRVQASAALSGLAPRASELEWQIEVLEQ